MVPAGNPCAEFESWSGLIAGSTIPHPDTVWRWVPGDRMHTRTFMHARLHTQPVSVACLLCLLLCFLVLLPLLLSFCLSCLQILWLMDMIILFFLLTHISIVDSCFPHVKSHYILQKKKQSFTILCMDSIILFILSMQTFPLSCQLKVLRMQHLTDVC